MARQYNVTHMNDIVVSSGSHNETLTGTGEQDITNAIIKVTRDTVKNICFVEGHGEKPSPPPSRTVCEGGDKALKSEGYEPKPSISSPPAEFPPTATCWWRPAPSRRSFPQEARSSPNISMAAAELYCCSIPRPIPKLDTILHSLEHRPGQQRGNRCQRRRPPFWHRPGRSSRRGLRREPHHPKLHRHHDFFQLARTVSIADKNKSDPQGTELLKTSPRSFTVPN